MENGGRRINEYRISNKEYRIMKDGGRRTEDGVNIESVPSEAGPDLDGIQQGMPKRGEQGRCITAKGGFVGRNGSFWATTGGWPTFGRYPGIVFSS